MIRSSLHPFLFHKEYLEPRVECSKHKYVPLGDQADPAIIVVETCCGSYDAPVEFIPTPVEEGTTTVDRTVLTGLITKSGAEPSKDTEIGK